MTTITVKCERCSEVSTGDSFKEAAAKIGHLKGQGRGIKCGDDRNQTIEVDPITFLPKNEADRRCDSCGVTEDGRKIIDGEWVQR